jgi:heme oxygenase
MQKRVASLFLYREAANIDHCEERGMHHIVEPPNTRQKKSSSAELMFKSPDP